MYELIYASRAVVDLSENELEVFLGRSRERNAAADITGCLLHVHDRPGDAAYFVQLLEGPQEAVEETYRRITQDLLHVDSTVVHQGEREGRGFEGWRMRLATITTESVLALIATDPEYLNDPRPTAELLQNPSLARALLELQAGRAVTP
ncbi:hypothetical protein Kisp01_06320 [Kineosporia sp. NBRC 101677]|uniref:BLUF domain-containing protein n=1 Tax=Kineosporia sp. NBRC 101677 TaxID=3032197 RepID=UPI0024A19746|nr:BLUF domain-containing protein [Kineosporia sp. NBRC 101677]GLY13616.1 hypothetical protein Kisp01_06320 [Kineosporia sp. NBRC 101677]